MIPIYDYNEINSRTILSRIIPQKTVSSSVSEIIETVKKYGDKALYDYTERFDGVRLDSLSVSKQEIEDAYSSQPKNFIKILEKAAHNIREFHSKQIRNNYIINDVPGVIIGQRVLPLERVGLYVPAGAAPLSSTVLMDAIPAKIAGCHEIIMVTSPNREGKVHPAILAAAKIAGVDTIYKVGGAHAIAALAYGTESIRAVDKIVGPGSAYVAEAKKQVFGKVSIDMVAGPSEILIISDKATPPRYLAADMLSQAEHDKMASAILITDCKELANQVQIEIEKQLDILERKDIASTAIDNNGKIIVTNSIEEAINIANELAPEHLELCVDNPFDYLDRIRHAGSVFLGRSCPEALGDYLAGCNHTLPTSGSARFSSPLSVDDFVKKSQFTYYTKNAFSAIAEDIAVFANMESLTGHARSALIRIEDEK